MALDALTSIVPPPQTPYETGQGKSWEDIESTLGTRLPSDYKEYINLYGTGELGGRIWVYNPFSKLRNQNLVHRVQEVLDIWRDTRAKFGAVECPYPLYPERQGLLPWGHIDTGTELFWQTSGRPEEWKVVVNEARGPSFEQFSESMSEFLTSLLAGRYKSRVLPKFSRKQRATSSFIPYRG